MVAKERSSLKVSLNVKTNTLRTEFGKHVEIQRGVKLSDKDSMHMSFVHEGVKFFIGLGSRDSERFIVLVN